MSILNANISLLEAVQDRLDTFNKLSSVLKTRVDARAHEDYGVPYLELLANFQKAIGDGRIHCPGEANTVVNFDGRQRHGATVSASISTELQKKLDNAADLSPKEMDELVRYLMEHPLDARLTADPTKSSDNTIDTDFDDFED